jgi:hypothetical protein
LALTAGFAFADFAATLVFVLVPQQPVPQHEAPQQDAPGTQQDAPGWQHAIAQQEADFGVSFAEAGEAANANTVVSAAKDATMRLRFMSFIS